MFECSEFAFGFAHGYTRKFSDIGRLKPQFFSEFAKSLHFRKCFGFKYYKTNAPFFVKFILRLVETCAWIVSLCSEV